MYHLTVVLNVLTTPKLKLQQRLSTGKIKTWAETFHWIIKCQPLTAVHTIVVNFMVMWKGKSSFWVCIYNVCGKCCTNSFSTHCFTGLVDSVGPLVVLDVRRSPKSLRFILHRTWMADISLQTTNANLCGSPQLLRSIVWEPFLTPFSTCNSTGLMERFDLVTVLNVNTEAIQSR